MLFIDGNNLINTLGQDANKEGREYLYRKLTDYSITENQHITLVFDAYKTSNKTTVKKNKGDVTVIYSQQNETADIYIYKQAKKSHKCTLVTSDKMLTKKVKQCNWKVIKSEDFAKKFLEKQHYKRIGSGFLPQNDASLFGNLDSKSSNNLRKLRELLVKNQ